MPLVASGVTCRWCEAPGQAPAWVFEHGVGSGMRLLMSYVDDVVRPRAAERILRCIACDLR